MSKRNSTLELFRVILMLMVITLHYFKNVEVLDKIEPSNGNYIFTWFVEAVCLVAVNCYVMLSAWFLSQKEPAWKKVVSIFLQVFFYSVVIYATLCLMGYQKFHFMTFITRYLFPLSSGYDWFATVYVVYILLVPFINNVGDSLDKKAYEKLLAILFIAFSFIPTVLFFSIDNLGVNGGYSLLWFVFLHFLIMFIRKFNIQIAKWKCVGIYFLCTVISVAVKIVQNSVMGMEYWNFFRYNSITTFIGAAALFLFFVQLRERHNRIICIIGSTTFGVLLIHTQFTVRTEILWKRIVRPLDYLNSNLALYIFHVLISVTGIFIICSLIDCARQLVFKCMGNILGKIRKRVCS